MSMCILPCLYVDEALETHSESAAPDLRDAVAGLLMTLFPETRQRSDATPQHKSGKHIMISYKHENPSSEIMRAFKDQLKQKGYDVWMDEERIGKDHDPVS